MSDQAASLRAKAKSKVERMVRADPHAKVDASDYSPAGLMDGDVQTGPRPISRRAFKSGGKVLGDVLKARADRKPRKSGGRAIVDAYINRDAKEANPGGHVGGYARGGHVAGCTCAKCSGGAVGKSAGGALDAGTRPAGGRLARKGGGRTKKGMNVNIIIAPAGGGPRAMPPQGAMPAPGGPVGLHQGAPPPMAPPMPPGAGAPPPMMPRKAGGRVGTVHTAKGHTSKVDSSGHIASPKMKPDKVDSSGHTAKPGKYPLKDGGAGGKGRKQKLAAYG